LVDKKQPTMSDNMLAVWLAFELDGEIEEVEVQVSQTSTVGELRRRIFSEGLFPLPQGVVESDVSLGREDATRFRALKSADLVSEVVGAPPRNAFTVQLTRGSFVVSSRGSFIRARSADIKDAVDIDTATNTNPTSSSSVTSAIEHELRVARVAVRWQYDVIGDKWLQTASLVSLGDDVAVWRDLADSATGKVVALPMPAGEPIALGEARARAVAVHWSALFTVAVAGDTAVVPRVRAADAAQLSDTNDWFLLEFDTAAASAAPPVLQGEKLARDAAAALAHFVYDQTGGRVVVLLERLDTATGQFGDAVVHTNFVEDINTRDTGDRGLKEFCAAHTCNALCTRINVRSFAAVDADSSSPSSAASLVTSVSGLANDNLASSAVRLGLANISLGNSSVVSMEKLAALATSGKTKAPLTPRTTARRSDYVAKSKLARTAKQEDDTKTYTLDSASLTDFGVLFTLGEHKSSINALVVHGDYLLSASSDKTVRVWSLATFECVQTLTGHTQEVTSLWLSDTHVLSGSQDGTVRCWGRESPFELRSKLVVSDEVWGVCTAAGRVFAAVAKGIVWWTQQDDVTFERSRKQLEGHKKTIKVLTATGDYVFSGANDKQIRVWDASSLECKYVISDHDGWIRSLVIHDKLLYSCAYDAQVKVWDLTTLTCVRTFKNPQRIESGCIWQDYLFAGTDDARMWVYPLAGTDSVATLKEHKVAVVALAASPDLVFSGSYDGAIKVWGQTSMAAQATVQQQ
jgi:WD40 repeat protein